MPIYHELAKADIQKAVDWFDERSNQAGDHFIEIFHEYIERITFAPQLFAKIDGCPKNRDIRIFLLDPFQFTVVYENTADDIVILAVTHASRKRIPWRKRSI